MKRVLLIAASAALLVLAATGAAYAGNDEGTFRGPPYTYTAHSGYAATSNSCMYCHDIHQNTNYKLFIADTATDGCMVCHYGVGAAATAVYNNAAPNAEHRVDASTFIPDATTDAPIQAIAPADRLDCLECHDAAPHGVNDAGVVQSGVFGSSGALITATDEVDYCTGCHDMNDGRVSDVGGGAFERASKSTHVMIAVGGAYTEFGAATADHADALATSANCTDCHATGRTGGGPHDSDGYKLLKVAVTDDTTLNDVCLDCHGEGVGITY